MTTNKEEYADIFMSRAKQNIKICENEHELQVYIASLLENIDYWQNEYGYMKKYRDTLQQENKELKEENKQLKDNWNKLKEILPNVSKHYKNQFQLFSANCCEHILEIMQELEKGSEE